MPRSCTLVLLLTLNLAASIQGFRINGNALKARNLEVVADVLTAPVAQQSSSMPMVSPEKTVNMTFRQGEMDTSDDDDEEEEREGKEETDEDVHDEEQQLDEDGLDEDVHDEEQQRDEEYQEKTVNVTFHTKDDATVEETREQRFADAGNRSGIDVDDDDAGYENSKVVDANGKEYIIEFMEEDEFDWDAVAFPVTIYRTYQFIDLTILPEGVEGGGEETPGSSMLTYFIWGALIMALVAAATFYVWKRRADKNTQGPDEMAPAARQSRRRTTGMFMGSVEEARPSQKAQVD